MKVSLAKGLKFKSQQQKILQTVDIDNHVISNNMRIKVYKTCCVGPWMGTKISSCGTKPNLHSAKLNERQMTVFSCPLAINL